MTSPRPQLPVLLALAVAVSLAGCGKDSPTQPSGTAAQQDADDATQQVAFLMAQDNGTSLESQATPGQSMTASRGTAPMSAQGVASTDTTFTIGSVTWTITRSFFNAIGTEQASYNPLTTVRMTLGSRGVGNIATAADTASYGTTGSLAITGLSAAQDTLTTNAARNDTLQVSFAPRFRGGRIYTYLEGAELVENMVQLKPLTSTSWPLSGTATWTLKVDRLGSNNRGDVSRHFNVTVVVTFNGTQTPDVTTTGGYRYKMNLKTGLVVRS